MDKETYFRVLDKEYEEGIETLKQRVKYYRELQGDDKTQISACWYHLACMNEELLKALRNDERELANESCKKHYDKLEFALDPTLYYLSPVEGKVRWDIDVEIENFRNMKHWMERYKSGKLHDDWESPEEIKAVNEFNRKAFEEAKKKSNRGANHEG